VISDRSPFVLAHTGHIAATQIRKTLAPYGFKPGHGYTLLMLADHGALSQQALAETLEVDPTVLVGLLNDLERDGLTERQRDPADRRRHIVQITELGKNRAAEIESAIADLEAALFAGLNRDEISTLNGLLARVMGGHSCEE
jgi:DNA-binding MarR family transcriptional regulator